MQKLCFDMSKIKVAETGVEGFCWPISQAEHVEIAAKFLELQLKLVRECQSAPELRDVGKACSLAFSYLGMRVLMAEILADRLKDVVVDLPASAAVWQLAFNGKVPEGVAFAPNVDKGLQEAGLIRGILRPLKSLILRDSWKRPAFALSRMPKNSPVCITGCDLAQKKSSNQKEKPHLYNVAEWFKDDVFDEQAAIEFANVSAAVDDCFFREFEKIIKCYISGLSDRSRDFLKTYVVKTTAVVAERLQRLNSNETKIPSELWTGSVGNIWCRMLACAVQARGGKVVVFDHAGGTNACLGGVTLPVDLLIADEFVSYSPQTASILEKDVEQRLPDWKKVVISSLANSTKAEAQIVLPKKSVSKLRILYPTHVLFSDMFPLIEHLPDICAVDLEARVSRALTRFGHDVALKPHPMNYCEYPSGMFDSEGISLEKRPFEECLSDYDLVVFDKTTSTTWPEALRRGVPIIVLDFENSAASPSRDKMLDTRVARVECHYDENNRPQFNENDLKAALEKALVLTDQSVCSDWFGMAISG